MSLTKANKHKLQEFEIPLLKEVDEPSHKFGGMLPTTSWFNWEPKEPAKASVSICATLAYVLLGSALFIDTVARVSSQVNLPDG